jgi:DNA-directed RNA polymerase specialized sigma24 family protein
MENPLPELSPEIQWMLESGQASSEMLAEALVREYWQPIYRFGLACLGDSRLAEQLAVESLSSALINVYRYRGGSVKAWLFQIVVKICQKKQPRFVFSRPIRDPFHNHDQSVEPNLAGINLETVQDERLWDAIENISPKYRLPFLLTYLFQWAPELIAKALKTDPQTIATQVITTRRKLIEALLAADYPSEELEFDRLDVRLHQLMEIRWPGIILSTTKLEDTIKAVMIGAEKQKSHNHTLFSVKEFLLVAFVIVLAAGLNYGGNLLFPEPDPTQPPVQTVLVTRLARVVVTPTPTLPNSPTPAPTQTPLPPPPTLQPLTLQSSSEAVWNSIYYSHYSYRTLWIDALLQFYGPEGFAGAPQVYRTQIWLDKTIPAGLLLGGVPGYQAEEIGLSRSGVSYWSEIDGLAPFKVDRIVGQQSLRSWYAANLVLYQPFVLGDSGSYRVTGREELLGRESLIVDKINLAGIRVATLWLDARTGLALRQRYYAPSQEDLYYEIRLLDLVVDPEIPADLFNPEYQWTGAFAKNVTNQALSQGRTAPNFYISAQAEMEDLPFAAAPADFEPGSSQLYFQISQVYYESPPDAAFPLLYKASVFTDQYYLGNLDFENPWDMICARSPDGTKLAIASRQPSDRSLRSLLRLYDLKNLAPMEGRTFLATVTQFAFAPDSRRLAIFASHEPYGSVYIIDTDSNTMAHLIDLPDARSFVWSPDGEYLAMIGRVTEPVAGDEVIVVRVSSGEITYHKSVDYEFGNLGDWPPLEWGKEFPVEMNGLTQCAQPSRQP